MDQPPFVDIVRSRLDPSLSSRGFRLTDHDASRVAFENQHVRVEVALDPRGEIDVSASRRLDPASGVWRYSGMAGRASVEQLIELAGERLASDPRVLEGDGDFFDELTSAQDAASVEWNAYYARTGPRPKTGKLS